MPAPFWLLINGLTLRLAALDAERAELLPLRDSEVINEHTLRTIEAEIDHAEMLIVGVPRVGHG
jgi:hypothetical protein